MSRTKGVRISRLRTLGVAALAIVAIWPDVSDAGTSQFRYDAIGRLTKACNTTAGQGYRTDYALDGADNRSSYRNVRTDIIIPLDSGVYSPDYRFQLKMQSDGNLIVYQNSPLQVLWSSGTAGSGGNYAILQSDGNLVVYRANGSLVWHSATYMYPCSKLEVRNDGNVIITSFDDSVVWQTNTGGH